MNLALWGHEHAYQRSCPVYQLKCTDNSTVDNSTADGSNGTVHVIVGMGGQRHSTGYP